MNNPNSAVRNTKNGIVIAIESIGLNTRSEQTKMLVDHLVRLGYDAKYFGTDDNEAYNLVWEYLDTSRNGASGIDKAYALAVYLSTKHLKYSQALKSFLAQGNCIAVVDGYTTEVRTLGKHLLKACNTESTAFCDWLDDLYYTKLELPKPDIEFLVGISLDVLKGWLKDKARYKVYCEYGLLSNSELQRLSDKLHSAFGIQTIESSIIAGSGFGKIHEVTSADVHYKIAQETLNLLTENYGYIQRTAVQGVRSDCRTCREVHERNDI